ncbi:MAG: hypothetical protein WCA19_25545, partial [Candidatus Acidiferrales bacterium]
MVRALTAPGQLLSPTNPDEGVSKNQQNIEKDLPALKAARLLHERGLLDVGTAAGAETSVAKGTSKFATSMIRPESLLLLTGGGIFEGIPQLARAGMSSIFGAQMAHQLVQQSPEFVKAAKAGDWDKAVEIASEAIPTAAMAMTEGLNAFKAGAGPELTQHIGEHLKETAKTFVESAKEEGKAALEATHPEGSAEAGFAKIPGSKKVRSAPAARLKAEIPEEGEIPQNDAAGFIDPQGKFISFPAGVTSHEQLATQLGTSTESMVQNGHVRKVGQGSYQTGTLNPHTVRAIENDIIQD